jgi:hypothetical protein
MAALPKKNIAIDSQTKGPLARSYKKFIVFTYIRISS